MTFLWSYWLVLGGLITILGVSAARNILSINQSFIIKAVAYTLYGIAFENLAVGLLLVIFSLAETQTIYGLDIGIYYTIAHTIAVIPLLILTLALRGLIGRYTSADEILPSDKIVELQTVIRLQQKAVDLLTERIDALQEAGNHNQ